MKLALAKTDERTRSDGIGTPRKQPIRFRKTEKRELFQRRAPRSASWLRFKKLWMGILDSRGRRSDLDPPEAGRRAAESSSPPPPKQADLLVLPLGPSADAAPMIYGKKKEKRSFLFCFWSLSGSESIQHESRRSFWL